MEQRAYTAPPVADATASKKAVRPDFATALDRYRSWCQELAAAIVDYQTWVEQQGAHDGEQDLRVYELAESVKAERLQIAIVGELSRGKTELLNALFFANFKQRLLPSAAGRTTMCPTELCYETATDRDAQNRHYHQRIQSNAGPLDNHPHPKAGLGRGGA
jgi:hypothetical protein